jgi:hypothetical protein
VKLNKKIFLILLIFLISIYLLLYLILLFDSRINKIKLRDNLNTRAAPIFNLMPDKLKSTLLILTGRRSFNNLFNDYNIKFLPDTQFVKLDFKKFKTSFDKSFGNTFFIEIYQDNLLLASKSGKFYKSSLSDIKKNLINKISDQVISKNLEKNNQNIAINDILVLDDKIFVLKSSDPNFENNNCGKLEIYFSEIKNILDFEVFKTFNECVSAELVAGGMQEYYLNNKRGIIISTGSSSPYLNEGNSQKDNSIFGKVIFVDYKTKSVTTISKGHRNPQGLAVKDNLILSTEHGPQGGDEINKILLGKNYGWPISSYGLPYPKNKDVRFYNNHASKGFEEPIYVFIPSIGISELIFLPNSFYSYWIDNVLITSLNGRSIFRTKFSDNSFTKVLFMEKIFIGERIRDIKYDLSQNLVILSLEDTGSLGVLSLWE